MLKKRVEKLESHQPNKSDEIIEVLGHKIQKSFLAEVLESVEGTALRPQSCPLNVT